jgi:hypothetical protein
VFSDSTCSNLKLASTKTDHAVVLVGYGTDDVSGKDYWIVSSANCIVKKTIALFANYMYVLFRFEILGVLLGVRRVMCCGKEV